MRLEDLKGRRLGRYEVSDVIGRGGMAAVYRARDTVLRRDVALKILYPQYNGDTALVERFQREAVLAAGLDHPNILPIYDVGEQDGLVYIAMRLLEGRSFADVLRLRGSLPAEELAPVIDQVASALDYAHARGIVHRDIKPANILIEERAGLPPHVVLTDFGIAKSLDPAAAGLTVTGVLIGTPEYMAPEQIRGGHLVDARADIYALGVLAYRALTGRRPFEGNTQEVLIGHLQGAFPDPTALMPGLPAAVNAVLRRALARDPGQRYASAGEFARALRAALGLAAPVLPTPRRENSATAPAPAPPRAVSRHEAETVQQATRRGSAAPPYARPAAAPAAALPGRAASAPAYRRERRDGGFAWVIIGALLALAIGGGMLYASGFLRGAGSGPTGATLPPSATLPAVAAATASPTETADPAPTAAPEPTGAPPTDAPTGAPTAAPPSATPTQTPKPTAKPTARPTNTPVPPTSTPAPPSATPTSSATPTPTSTPTSTPTPTPCLIEPIRGFGAVWHGNPSVREKIGCPRSDEVATSLAEQPFEKGSMIWLSSINQHYVLTGLTGGTWDSYTGAQVNKLPDADFSEDIPPGRYTPRRGGGFYLIWVNIASVRDSVGWALTEQETSTSGAAYQEYARGVMIYTPTGLGRGPTVYILYNDGSFERIKDPTS